MSLSRVTSFRISKRLEKALVAERGCPYFNRSYDYRSAKPRMHPSEKKSVVVGWHNALNCIEATGMGARSNHLTVQSFW